MNTRKLPLSVLCALPLCFAVSIAHTQTLPEIAGLQMHMDANNMSSLVMDGNSVYAWNDSSGRDIQFTPHTTGGVTYQSNVINGMGALHFNGVDGSFLQTTSPDALGISNDIGGITAFAVAFNTWPSHTGQGTQNIFRMSHGTGSATRFNMIRTHNQSGADEHRIQARTNDGSTIRSLLTPYGTGKKETWAIDSAYVNFVEGHAGIFIDGELMNTRSDIPQGNTSATDSLQFRIGASERNGPTITSSSDPNQNWNGYIAEILIFDRVLTEEEMFQVHSYLGEKYGIGIIPEPSTYALILAGGMLILTLLRKRKQ